MPHRGGRAADTRQDHGPANLLGTVVPSRARQTPHASPDADLSNVIPIASRRRFGPDRRAPEMRTAPQDRPAPPATGLERRRALAAFAICSFAIHASLFAAFNRPPPPLASLGQIVVSADLVIGTNQAAGRNSRPSESEIDSPAAPRTEEAVAERTEMPRRMEAAPRPDAAAPASTVRTEDEHEAAPLAPDVTAELPPPPDDSAETKVAPPEEHAAKKPARQKEPDHPKKTARKSEDGKSDRRRATAPSAPSVSSSGIGRGRSDAETNYRGLVAAHLARYKQFPAEARARGEQGSATVTFRLDGSGRVTAVRLTHGSGIASIDQEVQSMVRRASPFPAPPDGHGQSFTVPVSFYLH
ncbi:MAG TPA: energy transducer TonB [Pseudorhodoplanes sp.]|nr:energy transducer TonB [Pseudorhodoplanes sp.]